MTIQLKHSTHRMVSLAGAAAMTSAALLLCACGETPKMGASGSGSSGSAPTSTSAPTPTPAPIDAASAPKQ